MATGKDEPKATFVVDCPTCRAKVAAIQCGHAERFWSDADGPGDPEGRRVAVGNCPKCHTILVGEQRQIAFENWDSDEDVWSDFTRVFPEPPKTFASWRIPNVVRDSLTEAEKSLQAGANIAGCVMLGRTLEAICHDVIENDVNSTALPSAPSSASNPKRIILAQGIQALKDKGVIDERLYKWSTELRIIRNLAAHPTEVSITHADAEDLKIFVQALIEYVYDLADRYEDFKIRQAFAARRKEKNSNN